MKMPINSLVAVLCGVVAGCHTSRPAWIATGESAMVATDSAYASRAGVEILRAGGNAIDAAAAVSFALGVTRPYSTGPGGGGFMIIRIAGGETVVLDYRETAPATASADMYAETDRDDASRNGHLAVAVPGTVAGQCQALARFGTMPLGRVLQPAIRLASDGFAVDDHYVEATHAALEQFNRDPALRRTCRYVYETHLRNGRLPRAGQTLTQPALAAFLKRLASDGPEFFYRGDFAQALDREMAAHGGAVSVFDLGAYRVRTRRPVVGSYRGLELITMPPPSSGGVAIVQTLNTLERLASSEILRADPHLARHYFIEAMKHAFADRARWLADDDFVDVPVDVLTSSAYAARIAQRIGATTSAEIQSYGTAPPPDDAGTSHYCVVDAWGNVVVGTETINTSFGSLAAVEQWGVILNNEMDDFAANPGRPNAYGLIQSDRNAIAPKKRPLSSMSPTIVLKDDEPFLLIGASGGPRIISSVLNVLINVVDFQMSLEAAVHAPRLHQQWLPDAIYFDRSPPAGLAASLISRGHRLSDERKTGIVQTILRTPAGWTGASDPRKGGRPAGY